MIQIAFVTVLQRCFLTKVSYTKGHVFCLQYIFSCRYSHRHVSNRFSKYVWEKSAKSPPNKDALIGLSFKSKELQDGLLTEKHMISSWYLQQRLIAGNNVKEDAKGKQKPAVVRINCSFVCWIFWPYHTGQTDIPHIITHLLSTLSPHFHSSFSSVFFFVHLQLSSFHLYMIHLSRL